MLKHGIGTRIARTSLSLYIYIYIFEHESREHLSLSLSLSPQIHTHTYTHSHTQVLVLKRQSKALKDKDTIHGVIQSVHVENAGRGLPLKPDLEREIECMRTGISNFTEKIQYVECHSTGTPLGDQVEIGAMKAAYKNLPLLGTTKGNFGHTLVASAFAGIVKVLLSMRHGVIPPTPLVKNAGGFVSNQVVSSKTKINLKCAAVNAFGFGGTNAVCVIGSGDDVTTAAGENSRHTVKKCPVSVCGLAAHFNDTYTSVTKFLEEKEQGQEPHSHHITNFQISPRDYNLTPHPKDMLIPQQLLCLKVCREAVLDAKLRKGTRAAVLVAMRTEAETYELYTKQARQGTAVSYLGYIGNTIATRVSSLFNFNGPSFSVTNGVDSVKTCMKIASRWLGDNEVDAVIVAAVDLCGSRERAFLDGVEDGGDGAAAFVLRRHDALFSSYVTGVLNVDTTTTTTSDKDDEETKQLVGSCGIAFPAATLIRKCVHSKDPFNFGEFTFQRGERYVKNNPKLLVFQAKTRKHLIEQIVRYQNDNVLEKSERTGEFCLCCIDTPEELSRALRSVRKSNTTTYKSPKGSYFTCQPTRSEKLCLVFGDVGAYYSGVGKTLVKEFPYLVDFVKQRTLGTIDPLESSLHETSSTIELFRSVIYNSMLLTELTKSKLGIVAPAAACGLSLGEIGMLFSLNTKNTNRSSEIMARLEQSELWKKRLTNEKTVVTWKEFRTFMVMCPAESWENNLDQVDVLIVNGPDSILVGGSSENILRRCKEKNWQAYEIESNLVAHSSLITKEDRNVMDEIHDGLEWKADDDTVTKLLLSSKRASDIYSDRADFCATIDRVESVLGDSVAYVEVGVNDHRTRSLQSMNRFAVSVNKQCSMSSYMQLLGVAAQLRANQVRGTDTSLFEKSSTSLLRKTRSIRCQLNRGGRVYDDALLSDIAYQRNSAMKYV